MKKPTKKTAKRRTAKRAKTKAKTPVAKTTAAEKRAAAKRLRKEIAKLQRAATALELAADLQDMDAKAKRIRRRPGSARKTAPTVDKRTPARQPKRPAVVVVPPTASRPGRRYLNGHAGTPIR